MTGPGPTGDFDTGGRRAVIMTAAVLATGMTALDMTIGTVALPHMRGTFSSTQDQIGWVLTSYIVVTAILMPASGWLAKRFGRKQVFITALIGFTVMSVFCGLATSLSEEVVFRALQGAFGAPLVPLSQTIVLDAYPQEEHGKAISIWGFGVVLGPVIGPTLGGYLTENFSWPWIFYINIPIGIVTIACAIAGLRRTKPKRSARLDLFGFATLAIAVAAFQTMLDRGERRDWFESPEIVGAAAIAGLAFYFFIVHTATARQSFLNTQMFRDRNYTISLFLIFAFGFILLPPFALLPPFLQNLRDFPVSTVGLVMSPRAIGMMVGMLSAGRLLNKMEPRILMVGGLVLIAWGGWDMAGWNINVGSSQVIWSGVIQGTGMGLLYAPLFALAFATLKPELRGDATGFFQLLRNAGSSVSIAVFLALLLRNTTINRATILENITAYNAAFRVPNLPEAWSLQSQAGIAAIDREVTRQAEMIAYTNDFYILCLVAIAMIPLVLFLRRPAPAAR